MDIVGYHGPPITDRTDTRGLGNKGRWAGKWRKGVKSQEIMLMEWALGWAGTGENVPTLLDPGYACIKSLHFKKYKRKK